MTRWIEEAVAGMADAHDSVSDGLFQVGKQVVRMLESDGKPQQIRRSARTRPFARRAMLYQTLHASQRGRTRENLHAREDLHRCILPRLHPDRHHAAKGGHLLLRDRMPRIVAQSRV